jgi:hypothetical protein
MTQTFFEKSTGENYHQISSAAHSLLKKELARYLSLDADEVVIAKDEKGCPYRRADISCHRGDPAALLGEGIGCG